MALQIGAYAQYKTRPLYGISWGRYQECGIWIATRSRPRRVVALHKSWFLAWRRLRFRLVWGNR